MRSLAYFIKEALRNSRKNFSTTLGAVITIFLSLLIIGVFMVISLVVDQMVSSVESKVQIRIFLHDDASQSNIDGFIEYTQKQSEVSEVAYISKEEALKRLEEMSDGGNGANIVGQLDGNPLPASLEVALSDPERVEDVANRLQSNEFYPLIIDNPSEPSDSIKYGQGTVDKLFSLSNIIRVVCVVLVLLLVFVALIFINNTIRLAILARRKEIAIMRLVGASNAFIRGPFLVEGALQALIGAGLAIGSISLVTKFLLPKLQTIIQFLPINVEELNLWLIYVVLLGVGIVIGVIGSVWAMRRYLKV